MPHDITIRRATVADRGAVLRIAAEGMHEFGLVPDFAGLDAELPEAAEHVAVGLVRRDSHLQAVVRYPTTDLSMI